MFGRVFGSCLSGRHSVGDADDGMSLKFKRFLRAEFMRGLSGQKKLTICEELRQIPEDRLSASLDALSNLITSHSSYDDVLHSIQQFRMVILPSLNGHDIKTASEQAMRLVRPYENNYARLSLMNRILWIDPQYVSRVIDETLILGRNANSPDRSELLLRISSVDPGQLEGFSGLVRGLSTIRSLHDLLEVVKVLSSASQSRSLSTLCQHAAGLVNQNVTNYGFCRLIEVMTEIETDKLEAIMGHAARLTNEEMSIIDQVNMIRILKDMPEAELADFVDICEGSTFNMLSIIAQTPAEERREHADALNRHRRRMHLVRQNAMDPSIFQDTVDQENVMEHGRISRVELAIRWLVDTYNDVPSEKESIRILTGISEKILKGEISQDETEIVNARRTLLDPSSSGDFSKAMIENPSYILGLPGVGQLAAMVWKRIHSEDYTPHVQENLRLSFVKALAHCIEEDGHRVCGVGQTQRLLQVLQGYESGIHIDREVVTVNQLLSALASKYQAELAQGESCAVFTTMLSDARATFSAQSKEYQEFEVELREFFKQQEYPMPSLASSSHVLRA